MITEIFENNFNRFLLIFTCSSNEFTKKSLTILSGLMLVTIKGLIVVDWIVDVWSVMALLKTFSGTRKPIKVFDLVGKSVVVDGF